MVDDNSLQSIIGAFRERAKDICRSRRQQAQEDDAVLETLIDRLNLHSCSGSRNVTPSWLENEEIRNAYERAREDRDEYKFQLNDCKNKIKELKEELNAVRLNQTQHNISILTDISHNNERKSCAYSFRLQPGDSSNKNDANGELNTTFSVETKRELDYLHKTNEKYYEEIRKLKSDLVSQEALLKKLKNYEEEITKLRKIAEEKQEKVMNMQIEFDEKLKNCKRDYSAQLSILNNRIRELEVVRDALKIDLGAAQQEITFLQLSLKKPVEEATWSGNCIEIPDKTVTDSQQIQKETSREKEELLNVNTRRERRGQLQPIENIIKQELPTFARLSEQSLVHQQQASVDEVKDLSHRVTRGTKRPQRGGKGSKKETAAPQKQEAKKIKSSEEKSKDQLQSIKNGTYEISSDTRKGTRNSRKKATNSNIETAITSNKQNKKLRAKQETDENVEPCAPDYSSSSLNVTFGANIKLTDDTSTPASKLLKKAQDANCRRKRNK